MFSGGFNFRPRTRNAAGIKPELALLADWAMLKWRDYWHAHETTDDLQAELSEFLVIGADHAQSFKHLPHEKNATLARAILIGVGRSKTHPIAEIETALGVPLPPEAHK